MKLSKSLTLTIVTMLLLSCFIGLYKVEPVSAIASGTVNFKETGLAPGTSWTVEFDGTNKTSTTDTISFSDLSNGGYSYTIYTPSGHVCVSASTGTVTVSSMDRTIDVAFSSLSGTDWPKFHHDIANTGYSPSTGPLSNQTLWTYTTGRGIESSPAVVDGVVYIGSSDDYVYALDASTGAQIWNYSTGGDVSSCPAAVNGVVYVGSQDKNLYALNASTGAKIWNYTSTNAVYSPAVAGGVVYAGDGTGYVFALNASDGATIWNRKPGGAASSCPVIVNSTVYVGVSLYIYALNASDGATIWRFYAANTVNSPAVANGVVYITSMSSKNLVYALDASNGTQLWNSTIGSKSYSSPSVSDGVVYLGSDDSRIYALDAETGVQLWNYTTSGIVSSSPAVAGGVVYVGSYDYNLYALNASDGSKIWSCRTGNTILSSPAVVDGVVYIGSNDKKVYAFGTLAPVEYSLTMITMGEGTVSPGNQTCVQGTVANLTAAPDDGWVFSGWSGDVTGTDNPVSVTMDGNKTVTATFIQQTCNVAFTASGLASGTNWTVTLNGTTQWSTSDTITFSGYPDGQYVYLYSTPVGYWSAPCVGNVNVSGADKNVDLAFTALLLPTLGNWTYDGATKKADNGRCVVATSDGGYAIAGYTYVSSRNYDFWLVRVDVNGIQLWNKTYGDVGIDYCYSLIATSDGGFALAGSTVSSGNTDFWLVKVDANGNQLWNKTYGGATAEACYDLVATSDGGYTLAGTQTVGSYMDVWLVKVDVNGNEIWNQTYAGAGGFNDNCNALIATADGGYALAGNTYVNTTSAKFWLVKVNANGNVQWNQTYGESFLQLCLNIVLSPDGGYALVGKTQNSTGTSDCWLVKVDANGNAMWNQNYGFATVNDQGNALVVSPTGGYTMVGFTVAGSYADLFLVSVDGDGNQLWNQTYGTATKNDYGLNLIVSSDEGYAVAGYTLSYGTTDDFWLLVTDENGTISPPEYTLTTITVGEGTVSPINGTFARGTLVNVTATPASGWTFYGWSGDVTSTDNPISVTMDDNKTVTATFVPEAYDIIFTVSSLPSDASWSVILDGTTLTSNTSALIFNGYTNGDYNYLVKAPSGYYTNNPTGTAIVANSNCTISLTFQAVPSHVLGNWTYGGTGNDVIFSVTNTSDGGFALAGYTDSYSGSRDFWLVKVDYRGNILWNKTYGGSGADAAFGVVETSDGGFAIVGYSYSNSTNNNDVCLVKVDSNGTQQWRFTYGGTRQDSGYSLIVTSDGGFAIAGETYSYGNATSSYQDVWLLKIASNGTLLWSKTYGGTNTDYAYSLVETSDGGFAIGATTKSYGAGNEDVWLIRVDSSGNELWSKTYGGSNTDWSNSIVTTSDNGFAIIATTKSYGDTSDDVWLIRVDATGNTLWNKTYGASGYSDQGFDIVQTNDESFALAGYTTSYGAGQRDFWLISVDSNGNALWNKTYGGTGQDYGRSLVQCFDGGFAFAGYTTSFGAVGNDAYFVLTDPLGRLAYYSITVTQGNHGVITPGTTQVGDRESQQFTITPDESYCIVDVIVDGFSRGAVSTWTFTNVNENHTITATYALAEYTLNVSIVGNGTVTANPNKVTYHYGDVVELNANADAGWSFANWTGAATGTNATTSITIDGNKTVTALFTQLIPYNITFTQLGLADGTSWTVTFNGSTQFSTTGTIVFTDYPNGNYTYSLSTPSGYVCGLVPSGTVTVAGADVVQPVTFASLSGDNWPMFHHNLLHGGSSASTGPASNFTIWTTSLPSFVEYSSAAVVDGVVYVGLLDYGGSFNGVYALNASDGRILWSYFTSDIVYSSPAVVDGVVYFGAHNCRVYALNATTGVQIWNYTTGDSVFSSPAVVGGRVYVGSWDGNVYALDASTGAQIWNYTTGGMVSSSPAVANGVVFVGSGDGLVYALDAVSGALIWNFTTGGAVFSSAAVVDGVVYVGSGDSYVYALNASSGVQLWSFATGSSVQYSSAAVADGVVFVGSDDGSVYALDASTGIKIWNYTTGAEVQSSAAVVDGVVYVGSKDGCMYALDATTGAQIWSYATGYWVTSSPAAADGVVYIGVMDKFYAFGPGYTLTVVVDGEGSVASGNQTYAPGSVANLTASPADGWSFAGWSGDVTSTDNPISVTMDDNKMVTATFTKNSYIVTVNQNPYGTITPETSAFDYNDQATFTVTPDTGYCIASITVDGNPVTIITPTCQEVTFDNITANHTVTAAYQLISSAVSSIIVNATSTSIIAGATSDFYAYAYDIEDRYLGNITTLATWTLDSGANGSAYANGAVTATKTGSWNVTATLGSVSNSTTLTVTVDALYSIIVSPAGKNVTVDESLIFTAEGFDQYGNSRGDVTNLATWIIFDGSTTDPLTELNHQFTVVGNFTVTATVGGIAGNATYQVNPRPATTVGIYYAPWYTKVGETFTIKLVALDSGYNIVTNYPNPLSLVSNDTSAIITLWRYSDGITEYNVTLNNVAHVEFTASGIAESTITANVYVFQLTVANTEAGSNIGLPQGYVGDSITISGAGLDPEAPYELKYGGVSLANITTDASGAFTYQTTIPEGAGGQKEILLTNGDYKGSITLSTQLTVLPSISLSVTYGPVGTTVTVTGHGFTATNPTLNSLTASLNSTTVNLVNLSNDGNAGHFSAQFYLPSIDSGNCTFTINDPVALDSVSTEFQVTTAQLSAVTDGQNSGYVGNQITYSGSGFAPGTWYYLTFGGYNTANIQTNSTGGFSYSDSVMKIMGADWGVDLVELESGLTVASTTYTVMSSFVLNASWGPSGTVVSIVATGLKSGTPIIGDGLTATFNGSVVSLSNLASSGWGDFNGTFIVPSVALGDYILQITDNTGDNLTAAFQVTGYTITVTQNSHGTISPSTTEYTTGVNQTYTITPDVGYHIVDVVVDNVSKGAVSFWQFSNVAENHTITATYALDEYILTITTSGNGTVTKNPNQTTYHYGDIVELTATADAGWSFGVWTGNASGTSTTTSVTMTGNKTITATFIKNTYTLTMITVGEGTVLPGNVTAYSYGDKANLQAINAPGWSFAGWSGSVEGNTNTTLTMTANLTVTALFTENTYTIAEDIVGQGSIQYNATGPYTYGQVVNLTATPDAGWSFAGWSSGYGGSNPLTITVTENETVTATFIKNTYNITMITVGSGSVLPGNATGYSYGDSVDLKAINSLGWSFAYWTGAASGSTNTTITLTENATVTAVFTQNTYTLTVITAGHGSVNQDNRTCTFNETISINASPDLGWSFAGWSGDASGTSNTTVIMTANLTVTATFTQDSYALTVITVGQGLVDGGGNTTYLSGTNVTLNAMADSGWSFREWTGDLSGSECIASIIMDSNRTVTATFTQNVYFIEFEFVGNGSVNRNATEPYLYGQTLNFTAVPDAGWSFAEWRGAKFHSTDNPLIMTIESNRTITVTFTQDTYTLTMITVGSGTVSPGNQSYLSGTAVDLEAMNAAGWSFSGWSGAASASGNTTITMTGNLTVTAAFTQNTYIIDVQKVGSGTVERNATEPYMYGQVVLLTATPDLGWSFAGWSSGYGNSNPLTITITDNETITATFTKNVYTLIMITVGSGSVLPGNQTNYSYGDIVDLKATNDLGWSFAGWSGAATGLTNTTITMTENCTVTGAFTQNTYVIDLQTVGNGHVDRNASEPYLYGQGVSLTAVPDAGWSFVYWSDGLGTANPLTLTVTDNRTITATFVKNTYTLTMIVVGNGNVNPGNSSYSYNDVANLQAMAAKGWSFASWTGAASGTTNTTLAMTANVTVTATFTQDRYLLTVYTVGDGTVTPYNQTYLSGTNVTLSANANQHWYFANWTGALSGSTNPTSIIMDGNRTVAATFDRITYLVNFTASGVSSDYSGTILTVDGIDYKLTDLPLSFRWNSGSQHTYSYSSTLGVDGGKRYVWSSASGLSTAQSGTLTVAGAGAVNSAYATQYMLTVSTSHGSAVGGGWYSAGAYASASVTETTVASGSDTRYVIAGWSGAATTTAAYASVLMDGPKSVSAVWNTQYLISFASNPAEAGATNPSSAWASAGSLAISASPSGSCSFSLWSTTGSASIAEPTNASTIAVISGPATITANFKEPTLVATVTTSGDTYSVGLSGTITVEQMSNITITPDESTSTTMVEFIVTGESGTSGMGNLTISKAAIPFGTTPLVYIDGVLAEEQGYTEDANNYYVWYRLHFSTHDISIQFSSSIQPQDPLAQIINWLILVAAANAVAVLLISALLVRKKKKVQVSKQA